MIDTRSPGFRGFLHRLATTLDASDSLIEAMVGLVVIIGVTSSSRIGFVDPALGVDAVLITALLVAIVWSVIDGGFVLVASLFRQGRVRRLALLATTSAPDDPRLTAEIRAVADGSVADLLTETELREIAARIAASDGLAVRPIRLTTDDWMGALASALAMLLATLPPVLPFLLPITQPWQVAVSNLVAVVALYWIGWFWARWTSYPRWLGGLSVAAVGLAMVTLTVIFDVV
jgi:hypothetical protein